MICAEYFDTLTNTEKYEIVWEIGAYLGIKKDFINPTLLYQVNSFCVAVVYNNTLSEVDEISRFAPTVEFTE